MEYNIDKNNIPAHIAIIMDGNRRWAKERGLPANLGHNEGAKNLRRIAQVCEDIGVKYLTVFAFSTENWKRSDEEVNHLMNLLTESIDDFDKKTKDSNVRVRLVGDPSRLPEKLQNSIINIEERTKNNTGLTVNIAINYGGRPELIKVVKDISREVKNGNINIDDINEDTVNKYLYTAGSPDPDLMIRPGGEQRLSGFLIWQSAYTEYYFTNKYWPAFNRKELIKAIEVYQNRKRNFGK
jgi:undecaprenyl diphosphate synthase